jgi:hypothetical protein
MFGRQTRVRVTGVSAVFTAASVAETRVRIEVSEIPV